MRIKQVEVYKPGELRLTRYMRVNQTRKVILKSDKVGYVNVVDCNTDFVNSEEYEDIPAGNYLLEFSNGEYDEPIAVYTINSLVEKSDVKAVAELTRIV